MSSKCSQNLLDNAKQSATDALKTTSKIVIQKIAETTGDLIGNKIGGRVTEVSQTFWQNNLEKNTDEPDKDIPKERYVSQKERQEKNWWTEINIIVQ